MMLDGLRVLDIAGRSGAFCARILADFGADVVRMAFADEDDESARPPFVGEASVYDVALNANKRIVLEYGRTPYGDLTRRADVIVQTRHQVRGIHYRYEDIAYRNPRGVLVTITPYGTSGPLADAAASDLEVTAASGSLWLAGEPARPPVRTTLPQSPFWTGMYAAMGALAAIAARERTGRGQHVDVSAQAAMATIHPPAIVFWDTRREEHRRLGPYLMGRSIVGAKFRNIWPCADGHVAFAVQGGPIGRHTGRMLGEWMRERGAIDDVVGSIDWDAFDNRKLSQDDVDRLESAIAKLLATLTNREFFAGGIARNMLRYPVADARDIFADEQLRARGFWEEIVVSGRRLNVPGGFALFDGERPRVGAPRPQKRTPVWEVAADWYRPAAEPPDARAALGGIRVIEFGWAAAGPLVGKYLANHGAEVIHVESGTVLDAFRSTYPPFKGEPAPDTAAMFAFYNDSKKGVTLNLKHPKAVRLALVLIAKADIVIESFPAGTLARRGLTKEAMRAERGELVILSSCNQGQTGPHAQHPGYGSQLTALAGFNELLGERGRTPVILYGPYIDYIAVGYGVIAILAALERRRRTGEGCVIDLSQYEAGLQFLAPALLEHAANGTVPTRDANHDRVAVPHGVYPTRDDDRWVALSGWSDDEWSRLRAALGDPEWSRDAGLATTAGRRARKAELDARIAEWTRTRAREEVVATLRARGLRAAAGESVRELFDDAQLAHRAGWRRAAHARPGEVGLMAPPFIL